MDDLFKGQMKRIAFDLETLRMKFEKEQFPQYMVGAGVSVLCAIDMDSNQPWFFTDRDIGEFGLEKFAQLCTMSELLVSYNGKAFDIPVLSAATEREIPVMNHVDLYLCIKRALGGYNPKYQKGAWKLDRVGRDTIGVGKLMNDGVYAPQKWNEGRIGEVSTYCYIDTWLTNMLYKFITENGYVIDPYGDKISVDLDPC